MPGAGVVHLINFVVAHRSVDACCLRNQAAQSSERIAHKRTLAVLLRDFQFGGGGLGAFWFGGQTIILFSPVNSRCCWNASGFAVYETENTGHVGEAEAVEVVQSALLRC
jgi:hypothetical protein